MKRLRKLLQEIYDFEKYKYSCLDPRTISFYEKYLKKKLKYTLKEVTVKGLASSFKIIFRKNVKDSSDSTAERINDFMKATQNTKYSDGYKEIKPNSRTHLEIEDGKFCNKKTFRKEFEKEDFSEFKDKEDLSTKSTPETFLDKYLEIYDDSG